MKPRPEFVDVLAALERIRTAIHRTPVLRCSSLDRLAGAELYFKAENIQKTGSFKFRGASNAVLSLSEEEAAKGVATHSSGNHAQALSLAAKSRGVPAHIVMPSGAPSVKRAAVEAYGGRVTECGSTLEEREEALAAVLDNTGAVYIPSFDDPRIISGQGTAVFELLKESPEIEIVVAPLGGGGLLSGTSIVCKAVNPRIQVFGAEPELADDAFESLRSGRLVGPRPVRTVAEGLRMSLSELTFSILRGAGVGIVRVSEKEIIAAMRLLWERAKTIVEPSGAVGLAAVLRENAKMEGRKIGIILSGGNADFDRLKNLF